MDDTFCKCHSNFNISGNGKTLTSSGGDTYRNAGYGSVTLNSTLRTVYEWTFKINQKNGSLLFGITSQVQRNVNAGLSVVEYAYDGFDGNKWYLGKDKGKYACKLELGDTIVMNVDFKNRKISYKVNGYDKGTAFDNIKVGKEYCMVVHTHEKNNNISITDFKCIPDFSFMASIQKELQKCEVEAKEKDEKMEQLQKSTGEKMEQLQKSTGEKMEQLQKSMGIDSFDKAHKNINITGFGKIITASGGDVFQNAYGSITLNPSTENAYEWTFKINKRLSSLFIGITSQLERDINADNTIIDYGYNGEDGNKWCLGNKEEYAGKFETGDIVVMNVDFKNKTISYKVNDNDMGTAFDNIVIDKEYYMVVGLKTASNEKASISIADFKCFSQMALVQKYNAKLKDEKNELQQKLQTCQVEGKEKDEEIHKLQKENDEMKQKMEQMIPKELLGDLELIKAFFDSLPLPKYLGTLYCYSLVSQGFTTMELFSGVTHDNLQEINCQIAHRQIILKEIQKKIWRK